MASRRLLSTAFLALVVASGACSRTAFTTEEGASDAAASNVTGNGDGDDGSSSAGASHDGGSAVTTNAADGIDAVPCAGKTCKDRGVACGPSDDGCGAAIDCGGCAQGGATCVAGACTCTPKTCAEIPNVQCGYVDDGCGGNLDCGACSGAGQHCNANICTSSTCQVAVVMAGQCGDPAMNQIPDGCSSTENGEPCGANETCGGGGVVGRCGCTKQTCEQAGAECGSSGVADGCGGQLSCGECTDPPGACNAAGHCSRCVAVPDASLGFEAKCAEGTLKHAWACSCANGTCDVPDTARDSSPGCALLQNTGAHAVYCCTNAGTSP